MTEPRDAGPGGPPEDELLAAWNRLSARSRPRPVVRREPVLARGLRRSGSGVATAAVALVAVLAVAVVAFGVLSIGRAPGASPTPGAGGSLVAVVPSSSPSAATPTGSVPGLPTPSGSRAPFASVADGGLLTPTDGWALTADALHLTRDGGRSWAVAAPPAAGAERIVGAAFADALHGWLVSETYPAPGASGELVVLVHRTDDSGSTWETVELARVPSPGPNPTVGFPAFSILTPERVFIMLALPDAPGYVARLYVTGDGGRTWERRAGVTEGGRFVFTDERLGWAIRGDNETLVRTVDGGRRWSKVVLPRLAAEGELPRYPSIPVPTADRRLILLASSGRDGDADLLYTSREDGSTWTLVGPVPDGTYGSIAVLEDGTWLVGGNPPQRSTDDGANWTPVGGAPEGGMGPIRVGSGGAVSAVRSETPPCGPLADCMVPSHLWFSDDNGATWRDVTP